MSHPYSDHRQSKVERSRVSQITKECSGGMVNRAAGGAVHKDESQDKAMVKRMVKSTALKLAGNGVTHRSDRPQRASGGMVDPFKPKKPKSSKGKGKTNINIMIGSHKPDAIPGVAAPPPAAAPPPRPPQMMGPPPVVPAAGGPGGPGPMGPVPPGPPLRARGGKVDANNAGIGVGRTPVQHTNNKQDAKQIGRKRVITA